MRNKNVCNYTNDYQRRTTRDTSRMAMFETFVNFGRWSFWSSTVTSRVAVVCKFPELADMVSSILPPSIASKSNGSRMKMN